ncbi:Glycine-zipper containing OmpA-like membrane domain-containing protein [Ferrimonas sediminum]|uniref:Glycine-zipper containing OmpA-like membrane domain-containing protein n=1 Tax=Ferrimonas sediminum TaxID=718193 RepID=A0A1G8QB12_9GAMM|nr:glycine zipper family protein [Ferrimonas sediminum]SDJ01999.1 Glycine-zipper containing OmpA-like membrane domain-containing protein [Ferrimonas sediminum]
MLRTILALTLATLSLSTVAQDYIIYPAAGQDAEQQKQDTLECQAWATENTGVDPVQLASQPAPASQQTGGERARGALGGAAAGAAIGAIAGDAGEGAAIGAAVGTMRGGSKRRQAEAANQQAQANAQADKDSQMAMYTRAFKACMEGREYSLQ